MENYTHLCYVHWEELGVKIAEFGRMYTKSCLQSLNERLGFGLEYDELQGSPKTLQRFVNGEWESDEFLLIEPGKKLRFDGLHSRLYVE